MNPSGRVKRKMRQTKEEINPSGRGKRKRKMRQTEEDMNPTGQHHLSVEQRDNLARWSYTLVEAVQVL